MRRIDLAAFLVIARKEAEKALDPPQFEVRDGHLFAIRRGSEIDLGDIRGPAGEDGVSIKGDKGLKGDKGERGEPGLSIKGDRGEPGQDGRGIASAAVNDAGHLIISLTDGSTIDAGLVRGRDGRDGIDGKPGKASGQAMFFGGGVGGGGSSGGGSWGSITGDIEQQSDLVAYVATMSRNIRGGRPGDSYAGGITVNGGAPGE